MKSLALLAGTLSFTVGHIHMITIYFLPLIIIRDLTIDAIITVFPIEF